MKPYQEQSYYELLEVAPGAPSTEIRAAYERAVETYAADSVALYALEDPQQAEELRRRLRQAMEILTDRDRREEYDRRMGFPVHSWLEKEEKEVPAAEAALAAAELLASSEALRSTHPEVKVAYATPVPPSPPHAVHAAPPVEVAPPPEPPAPAPSAPEPPPPPPPPRASRVNVREIEAAPGIGEQEAIASAEAAMASAAARAREIARPRVLEIPEGAEFSGEMLRRARESRGLTIQQIADRTRISARHLENIEADRYAALPATVYLRGILCNLARELGLDQARVARSYLELAAAGKKG